ncbi:ABC transporter substrate-binding protein [Methylomonas sp.]|uniref:MlaC/ttg2D family ABC transporter substrate-binding protein n=1 Tax=Methylomonas sp. TaxID=418 RepID=UPI0025ECEFA6|nr:ABC transporter substrate-binding protein [Methylomonas sp.]
MKLFGIMMAWTFMMSGSPGWAGDTAAQPAEDPQSIIAELSNKIQARLQDRNSTRDFKQVTDYVSSVIEPHTDFDLFSVLVLGKYWKTATTDQRNNFKQAFKSLLIRVYSRGFVEFNNWTIKFLPFHHVDDVRKAYVKTQVIQAERKPVAVDYRMVSEQGVWKVYDILIDGVSLVTTYRSSFQNDIDNAGGSLDKVIDKLNTRNREADATGQ